MEKASPEYIQFVNGMDQIMFIAAGVGIIIAILLFVIYKVKLSVIKSVKGK